MAPRLTEANLNDPVTTHLRRDFTAVQAGQTVGEVLARLRERPPEGRIIYFHVVDHDGRLQGVVPTRRLLLSSLTTPITEIMDRQVISIPQGATVLDACGFFTLHRLLAFPVVDEEGRLIGVVDVELYTDEVSGLERHERQDDLFQLIGVHVTETQQASSLAAFRSRMPWLLCNIAGGIAAAFLARLYEHELQRAVALALFIPVVLALAESVSIQSVSLALQALHGRRPTRPDVVKRTRREGLTGLLLGGASGMLVGMVALLWLGQWQVALCLLGAIAGGVAWAAVFGIALPNLLRLVRRDPRVAAGPIALAASDLATLLLYFNLARWLLP